MRYSKRIIENKDKKFFESTKRTQFDLEKLDKYTACLECGKRLQDISQHYKIVHPELQKQPKKKRRTKEEIKLDKLALQLDLIEEKREANQATYADLQFNHQNDFYDDPIFQKRRLDVALQGYMMFIYD